jgi:hypothetical protein
MAKKKMKLHRWEDVKRGRLSPSRLAAIEAKVDRELVKMDLRAVRELVGKTQADVAPAAGMAQGEVSRLERREDHRLSTLRRYIEALGGELEVRAVFGDKAVRLHVV